FRVIQREGQVGQPRNAALPAVVALRGQSRQHAVIARDRWLDTQLLHQCARRKLLEPEDALQCRRVDQLRALDAAQQLRVTEGGGEFRGGQRLGRKVQVRQRGIKTPVQLARRPFGLQPPLQVQVGQLVALLFLVERQVEIRRQRQRLFARRADQVHLHRHRDGNTGGDATDLHV